MGWEAHFLYPFGMYVAWQIGFLIMTGNFFLKLDEILFPDKNCPNFLLLSTSEARRQLSTLVEITPLPLFHKALLHRY